MISNYPIVKRAVSIDDLTYTVTKNETSFWRVNGRDRNHKCLIKDVIKDRETHKNNKSK